MADVPIPGYLSDGNRTVAEMQNALEDVRDVLTELPGGSPMVELTIAGGSVTPTIRQCLYAIDTESNASADDLDHILTPNTRDGQVITIRGADAGRVVTLRPLQGGDGQLALAGWNNVTLDDQSKFVSLLRVGTTWWEISRSRFGPHQGISIVEHFVAPGVSGGTFTAGSWQRRPLNFERTDGPGRVSVAGDQLTVLKGRYLVEFWATAFRVDGWMARVWNVTDGIVSVNGNPGYSSSVDGEQSISQGANLITLTDTNVFEVQSSCETTHATTGFGRQANLGNSETYTHIRLTALE